MTFLRINSTQAESLRGSYGEWHALDPVPLPETDDYILTDAVMSHPAFAEVLDTLESLPTYPAWQPNTAYSVGDIVEHGDRLWRVVQGHTSQADWQPPVVPALFTAAHLDGHIYEWQQPQGAHDSYPLGALVVYQDKVWRSTINANVWEPGVFGWVVVE